MGTLFLFLGLIIGAIIAKKLFIKQPDFKGLVQRGALIVDVRTPQEFDGGSIRESINIPVGNIAGRAEELKSKGRPIILVCASGMRSHQAVGTLKRSGVECYNGGNWNLLQRKIS
jgi:phage shock protein E